MLVGGTPQFAVRSTGQASSTPMIHGASSPQFERDLNRVSVGELRAEVAEVTGVDVSHVPVRRGSMGGGKRAQTHDGRIDIGSRASELDLVHELAHAAQQSASTGTQLDAAAAERRADDVASAVVAGKGTKVAVGRTPRAAVQAAGEQYITKAFTLPPLPKGVDVAKAKRSLANKIKSGLLTSYTIAGAKAGDPAQLYLYNALIRLADPKMWGTEVDVITQVGKATGMITVRFDHAGKATATLLGKTTPKIASTSTFASTKLAKQALITKFKLASIKGEKGRYWKAPELSKVHAAWSRLSPVEAAYLNGFTLIRTNNIVIKGEKLRGYTDQSDTVAKNATIVTRKREIRFADSAFSGDSKRFVGDAKNAAPGSFVVLIHEVAHAIEAKPYLDRRAITAAKQVASNKVRKVAHALQVKANKTLNRARKGRYPKSHVAAGQPFYTVVSKTQEVLKQFEVTPDAAHEAAAAKAIGQRNTAQAKVPKSNKILRALGTTIAHQDKYFAELKKLRAAQDNVTAASANTKKLMSGSMTKRVKVFVDFVNQHGIKPVTPYAKKHWPGEPVEFYSEAFSMWKNDPKFLSRSAPKLKTWFDAGNHMK